MTHVTMRMPPTLIARIERYARIENLKTLTMAIRTLTQIGLKEAEKQPHLLRDRVIRRLVDRGDAIPEVLLKKRGRPRKKPVLYPDKIQPAPEQAQEPVHTIALNINHQPKQIPLPDERKILGYDAIGQPIYE